MNAFDPDTYTYTIDGRAVPSVTTVLNDLLPCFQAGEWYLNRGIAVHACCAMIARGKAFEHDPEIDGQVRACRRFFAEVKPVVIDVERRLYSTRYGFAGTFDMVCKIDGRVVLLDWKASFNKSLPYQLAGYALLNEGCIGNQAIKYGCGVQLCDDGTYHMSHEKPHGFYDLRSYKNGFLALLSAYNIRKNALKGIACQKAVVK